MYTYMLLTLPDIPDTSRPPSGGEPQVAQPQIFSTITKCVQLQLCSTILNFNYSQLC